jgi:predicted DNA repair protein MutK
MIELKNQNPGSTVVVGVAASLFDDLATDIDDIPVMTDHPIKKAEKKKVKAVVDAMKRFSEQ